MVTILYSKLFSFLDDNSIKYEIEFNIVRLIDYDFTFFLVLKTEENSPTRFNKIRAVERNVYNKFLIFIWYDLWGNKSNVIISKITHLCSLSIKIHARKTSVELIDKQKCELFFTTNHLNKPILGYKRIGLVIENDLIAVATFAKRRKFRDGSYSTELLQFATKNGIHINGGLSKLTNHFNRLHESQSLMTYIDLDWSTGEKFMKIGFEPTSIKEPVYFTTNPQSNVRDISEIQTEIFNMGSTKSILKIG